MLLNIRGKAKDDVNAYKDLIEMNFHFKLQLQDYDKKNIFISTMLYFVKKQ